jgi:dihydroorotate dehydrogenase (NAD+) catalytic subunit
MAASGTYGYSIEFDVFCNVQNLGAIVTKGITLEPRAGNDGERIFEVGSGLINRIGLENVGIENFIKQKKRVLEINEINYIANIAGNTLEEYFKLAQICEENGIKAIELNVSCPNVEHGCIEFGTDPKTLQTLVEGVRTHYTFFSC